MELLYADDRKKGSYREEWWSYCMHMIEGELQRRVVELLYAYDRRGVTEKSGGATACR